MPRTFFVVIVLSSAVPWSRRGGLGLPALGFAPSSHPVHDVSIPAGRVSRAYDAIPFSGTVEGEVAAGSASQGRMVFRLPVGFRGRAYRAEHRRW